MTVEPQLMCRLMASENKEKPATYFQSYFKPQGTNSDRSGENAAQAAAGFAASLLHPTCSSEFHQPQKITTSPPEFYRQARALSSLTCQKRHCFHKNVEPRQDCQSRAEKYRNIWFWGQGRLPQGTTPHSPPSKADIFSRATWKLVTLSEG